MTIAGDFCGDITLNGGEIKNANVERLASPPENATQGRIYYNTTNKHFYGYNGSDWVLLETLPDSIIDALLNSGELLGSATSNTVANTLVLRDENGSFEGDFTNGANFHNSEIKNFLCDRLSSNPETPTASRLYFNTTDKCFYGYNGIRWVNLSYDKTEALVDFYSKSEIDAIKTSLQGQIDGGIQDWFYPVAPTLTNEPYTLWTTVENKNQHLGDLYYDTVTGYCYRFLLNGETYGWTKLTDTDITKALSDAAIAQTTADSKAKVFSTTPSPPYNIGDLWVQGSSGDILKCSTAQISSGSYSASHWVRSFKYDMARSVYDTNASGVVDNAEKVNGLSVLTAVPSGAVFTDTVTTINGKTGVIAKSDIMALGIPGQDTTYSVATQTSSGLISGEDKTKLDGIATGANNYVHPSSHSISEVSGLQTALDNKVDDTQVLTNVPANALFTDTVYVHPSNHAPSIITQDSSNRFVTDAQITSWTEKQSSLGFTPENVANKGQASGYAGLGTDGKVPLAQLPTIPEGHTHTNKSILDKITVGTETSYDLDSFVTESQLVNLGAGDMLKSTYDTTNNGIVDNSEKVNGLTVQTAVPTNAVFTDTVYTHPSYTAYADGLYKITTNALGHVSSTTAVSKSDITTLGIPAQDTTYSAATTTVPGLMSATDKTKIDGISSGAQVNNISDTNATNLTGGNASTLHYHASDRSRSNHTGTQTSSTISDFANTVIATVLTGLSVATNSATSAADTILVAIGKLQAQITAHLANVSNPHSVTKTQVGLGNVDNTSDASKPVSTATQTALNLKADTTTVTALTAMKTATITTTWSGTSAPYTQTIAVTGITSTDCPLITPVYSATLATAILEKTAWNLVGKIETGSGNITVTCFSEKPVTAINIQLKGA